MKNTTIKIDENTSMFRLAGPIFAELLLNILLSQVDTVMLSRYNRNSVGAVGNSNQLMMLFIIMFGVIATATGVVVSQYLGAGKTEEMDKIYSLAVIVNLVLGALLSGVLYALCPTFVDLMKVDAIQVEDAITYTKIVGGMLFLQAGFNVMNQILRCNGYTNVGLYISLTVNLINIVGNYLFLYGPLKYLNLGVAGVAISTVLARVVALIISIVVFLRFKIGHISLRFLKPFPGKLLVKMLRIGIPSAGESFAYTLYQVLLLSFINDMGASASNAKVYVNTLMSFSVVFSNAMAQANMIVTGHLVGFGKEREADRRVMKTLRTSLPVAIVIATLNWLLCPYTLILFNASETEVALVRSVLLVGILMEIGRTTNLVIINSMKAAGDVLFPVLGGMATMWSVGIGVGLLCGVVLGWGISGIFMGTMADECTRGIIMFIRWRRGSWKGKAIVKKDIAAAELSETAEENGWDNW